MMGVFTFIIMIVALVTLGEVASKWLEGSRARPSVEPAPDGEMARLREQVESLTDRVEQLSEEQRFLTRLLEERPRATALPTSGESRPERSGPPPEGPD